MIQRISGSRMTLMAWKAFGLPPAIPEYQFCPGRRWRFDFAWPAPGVLGLGFGVQEDWRRGAVSRVLESSQTLNPKPQTLSAGGVAVEIQGGIWTRGRHTRGAALKLEWEKLNTAAVMGWRILYVQPADVCGLQFVNLLKRALLGQIGKRDREF